ncbi:MAG TPA: LEA type 2 family protein [Spirochaetia bacterium]|nr:LEA type 2 family protein [Spirochaetia bacterium]
MRRWSRFIPLSLLAVVVLAACAHRAVVPSPPEVRITTFRSTLFTPDFVRFQGRLLVTNTMRASLDLQKVDYGLSLFDKDLLSKSFSGLEQIRRNGTETVNLPMQISMKDILAQHIAILADGKMRFTFRGTLYPSDASGFSPIPFSETIEIPIPKIPEVGFVSTTGVPLTKSFHMEIGVRNPNTFPISINNVDTYLDLNGQRYKMVGTQESVEVPATGSGTVVLLTQVSDTAALSMALNVLENQAVDLKVGGSFTAGTPYGYVYIPVEVEAKSAPKS